MLMIYLTLAFVRFRQSARVAVRIVGLCLLGFSTHQAAAQDPAGGKERGNEVGFGEVIYVPVYSHIVQAEKASRQRLSSTLAIHNADPQEMIRITSVRYYDHAGTPLKEYLDVPRSLGPFASANFVVDITEDRGGVGANFIVEWRADSQVVSPIVEAIMTGGAGTQGLSFVTRGKVIQTRH